MRSLPLLTVSCLLLLGEANARAEKLTRAQIARLDAGKVIARHWKLKGTNVGTGKAACVIDATVEQVRKVVADVARYKEYIDRVVDSRVTKRARGYYHFYYRIDMPWPLSDRWCETKNRHSWDARRRVFKRSWTLLSGTFLRNEGYWQIRPWRRTRALAIYSVVLQIKTMLPQAAVNYVTKKALPRSVLTLRRRVTALKRRGAL